MNQLPLIFVSLVLIIATIIDIREHKIPNWLTYPFIFSSFIWLSSETLSILILAIALWFLTSKILGAGDIKLAAGIQIWSSQFNWSYEWWFYSLLAALLISILIFLNRAKREGFKVLHGIKIPMAPFMALGFFYANRSFF